MVTLRRNRRWVWFFLMLALLGATAVTIELWYNLSQQLTPVQIDQAEPLAPQITAIVDTVGLSSEEWQTRPLLINPPGYAPAAFVLLAELHGRIGHFPSLIRLRPRSGPVTIYEVAELLNLQTIREAARKRRQV